MNYIALMRSIHAVARSLAALASDVEDTNPDLAEQLRDLDRELHTATQTFAFGRPLRSREPVA